MAQVQPDWEEAGCSRSCRRRHTYRWGSCAFGVEPEPSLSSFELARNADGEVTGYYKTMDVEQVAGWLREQGFDVTKRAD